MSLTGEMIPASIYRQLREERDELAERVLQLEGETECGSYDAALLAFHRSFSTTKCEGHLLWHLMRSRTPVGCRVLDDWPSGRDVAPGILNVYVLKLRRKLSPHDFEIKNHWGEGYYLSDEAKAELRRVASAGDAA